MKDLAGVSKEEQSKFIDSFDRVLFDIDGVLWTMWVAFPGATECLENLKKLGKTVNFVTNNAATSPEDLHGKLIANKFSNDMEDIINPFMATVDFLEKNKFDKTIYAIASTSYKNELRKRGFKVAEDPPQRIEETIVDVISNIRDDETVGAVIFDFDINVTYIKLQKALTYLKRRDCLFLTGAGDKKLPVGKHGPLIGNHFNYIALECVSGRTAVQLAKPSGDYNKYVADKLNITNPDRALFVGDAINEDMGFATVGGYRKLLMLSGATHIEDIENWNHPEEYKPDYYIKSITEFNQILESVYEL